MIKRQKIEVALPEELLNSFAKALVPEIRAFYASDKGKAYFEKWLATHPEYNENASDATASEVFTSVQLTYKHK